MDNNSGKPLIFLSSTIFDLKDLRSSMKYFLEESGYKVALSECNDFYVDHQQDNFTACLKQIDSCDYFILLVGHRRGSWFKENTISITQHEYRHALELQKDGKNITILCFVRNEIWEVRKDRSKVNEYFSNRGKVIEDIYKIKSETFQDDPEFIFNFLDEISKIKEEKIAIKTGERYPKNNWIYSFSTFNDIAMALETTFGLRTNRKRELLKPLLKQELKSNLIQFFDNYSENKSIFPINRYFVNFPTDIRISENTQGIKVPIKCIKSLGAGVIKIHGMNFETIYLNEILLSGEFLDYDSSIREFNLSKFLKVIQYLKAEIDRFQYYQKNHFPIKEILLELSKDNRLISNKSEDDLIDVSTDILLLNSAIRIISRIIKPIIITIAYLEGNKDALNDLSDNEITLLSDSGKEMQDISYEDILKYISDVRARQSRN